MQQTTTLTRQDVEEIVDRVVGKVVGEIVGTALQLISERFDKVEACLDAIEARLDSIEVTQKRLVTIADIHERRLNLLVPKIA